MAGASSPAALCRASSSAAPDSHADSGRPRLTPHGHIVDSPPGRHSGGSNDMLPPKAPSWVSEFRKFIMRGNVVDLAVGLIIGVAFTGVVSSLVKDVFNPFLGLLTGGLDFSNVFVPLNGQHYANLADAQKAGAATVNIGLF